MLFYLFHFFAEFLVIIVSLVFAILAYHNRKQISFFYLGLGFGALATVLLGLQYEFILNSPFGWFLLACLATSTTFLILSKAKPNIADNDITDAYLNEIIEGNDEDWDPESGFNPNQSLDDIINGPDEEWDPESIIERQEN